MLEKAPEHIKSITLIGGYHKDQKSKDKSKKYLRKIIRFFEKKGFNVNTRIDKDPDEDFIYMSRAKYFSPGGGGFSNLIKQMVLNNKNTILLGD